MLTGAPAFDGETITDVLAHIVERDPNWSRLPRGVPGRVDELLRRCLTKNPKDRLRDIADARFEIEHVSSPSGRTATASAAALPQRSAWITAALAFAAGAAIAAAIAIVVPMLRTTPVVPQTAVRTVVTLPPDTTVALSRGSAVALSPDGKTLVFAGNTHGKVQLYLRPLDRFESQPLPGTDDAASPFFSPDGRWVGFFADGKLKKVSLDGGAPVPVTEAFTPRGEVWGRDRRDLHHPDQHVSGLARRAGRRQGGRRHDTP